MSDIVVVRPDALGLCLRCRLLLIIDQLQPLWSTVDRVTPKAPRRYVVLIPEAGTIAVSLQIETSRLMLID